MIPKLIYNFNIIILAGHAIGLFLMGVIGFFDGSKKATPIIIFSLFYIFATIFASKNKFEQKMGLFTKSFCYSFGIVYSLFLYHVITVYIWWRETKETAYRNWHDAIGLERDLKWHDYVASNRILMENMHVFIFYILVLLFYPIAYHIVLNGDHKRLFSNSPRRYN